MDVLRAGVSLLAGLHQPAIMRAEAVLADGLRLTAKLPMLVAAYARPRGGGRPQRLYGAAGRARPDISTFVARIVASAQNDLYAAIDAALAALKGNGTRRRERARHAGLPGDRRAGQRARLHRGSAGPQGPAHGGRPPDLQDRGPARAPPAPALRRPGRAAGVRAHAVAEAVAAYIIEQPHFQARKLYPNVEFYSAPLLYQLGLPLDAFTLAFAMARMPGWSATSASSSPWPAWFAPRPSMSARPRAPSSPWRIASSAEG
jgi:citrate synthase